MSRMRSVSNRIRFEVFKRDFFTCQYCGRKAPEIVLQVDHIEPVAKGGKDDLLNLITACVECNAGKGAHLLGEHAVLDKKQRSLELLAERREQLKMLNRWQRELSQVEKREANRIAHWISKRTGSEINEKGKLEVRRWIEKYGFAEILDATERSFSLYYTDDDKSWDYAFEHIPNVAKWARLERTDPEKARYSYVAGTLRGRLPSIDSPRLNKLFDIWRSSGWDVEELVCIAKSATSWRNFLSLTASRRKVLSRHRGDQIDVHEKQEGESPSSL